MLKPIVIAMLVAALSAPVAFAGADPAAGLKTDLAKALADGQTQHDSVVAAARKVASDATAGSRTSLQADVAALRATIASAQGVMKADRATIQADLEALKAGKAKPGGDLPGLLAQARSSLKGQRQDVDAALAAARQAFQQAVTAAKSAHAARPTTSPRHK